MRKILIYIIVLGLIAITVFLTSGTKDYKKVVQIGYFDGARTLSFYKAFAKSYFKKVNVNVELYTSKPKDNKFYRIPKPVNDFKRLGEQRDDFFGKVTGVEIIEEIVKGNLDGGTVGEASFLYSVSKGAPVVGVAILGQTKKPGKALALRKDIVIKTPEDFKGKNMAFRHSGPGDSVVLKEYIESIGFDPKTDITILNGSYGVYDNDLHDVFRNKEADGGIFHRGWLKKLISADLVYIYKSADWIDPELSFALLVFHKDFIKNHSDKVVKIIKAYLNSLKEEDFPITKDFNGISGPVYPYPPEIPIKLLSTMKYLLLKHKEIENDFQIEDFIDQSFVEQLTLNIKRKQVSGPFILKENGIYKMWYKELLPGRKAHISYATSLDGIDWEKYENNPIVEAGSDGEWNSKRSGPGSILKINSVYKIWYAGFDNYGISSVGYAQSQDGITWENYQKNPVLKPSDQGWDSDAVIAPNVIYDNNVYKMWYRGHKDEKNAIGYATSDDGIHWEKYKDNPILEASEKGWDSGLFVGDPHIVKKDNTYHMWYSNLRSENGRRIKETGYAVSENGINWDKYEGNPVLQLGNEGEWDSFEVANNFVIFDEGVFKMWYKGSGEIIDSIGYATSSDGIYWEKHNNNPVLKP